jgi:serine/threonine protein kinase
VASPTPPLRESHGILQYTPLSRTHHGLVQILHVGRPAGAGYFYYVMELADCAVGGRDIDPDFYQPRTLAHEIDTRGRLPVREALELGLDLAEALRYLHGRQLVHRDIKPANIIYVNGLPELADVGLVTHTAEARREPKQLGTEGFVPPEGPGTPSADVYSLGKVLCEACLGRAGLADPHLPVALQSMEHAWELDAFRRILAKACDEDARLRHPSVAELEADLIALDEQLTPDRPS